MDVTGLAKLSGAALKRRITTTFELPLDIMLDLPSVNLIGDEKLVISNHKGIAEYIKEQIKIKTSAGIVKILGDGLVIKEISRENIVIAGKIDAIVMRDR